MIDIEAGRYYTAVELAVRSETTKTYICRLCREGRIRHLDTPLGYLIPEKTALDDWDNRKKNK